MQKQIVILAAGKGTRMKSDIPKPMHLVQDTPMLQRVVNASLEVTDDVVLVHSQEMQEYLQGYTNCQLVLQNERLGTAHAVFCALDKVKPDSFVVVIYADHPFIDSAIINKVFDSIMQSSYSCVMLASIQEQENAYGRIVHNGPEVLKIVEAKDLSEEEKSIKLCNSAVISFAPGVLNKYLPIVMSEKKFNEYYLTSMVEVLVQNSQKVSYFVDLENKYSLGVNTKEELDNANQLSI